MSVGTYILVAYGCQLVRHARRLMSFSDSTNTIKTLKLANDQYRDVQLRIKASESEKN